VDSIITSLNKVYAIRGSVSKFLQVVKGEYNGGGRAMLQR